MNYSYCPTCRAEVQDSNGFCLLGHRMGPALASLSDLRAEVDSAFAAARSRVAEVLKTPPPAPPPLPPTNLPPPEQVSSRSTDTPEAASVGASGEPGRHRHLAPAPTEAAFFARSNGSHSAGEPPAPTNGHMAHPQAPTSGSEGAPRAAVVEPAPAPPLEPAQPPAPQSTQAHPAEHLLPTSRGLETLWGAISGEQPSGDPHDPITAFAPVPSIDWGPERQLRRRRGRKGKQP